MIKLKENEGSPNVEIIINAQTYKMKGAIKYILDIKGHKFIFQKKDNQSIYIFYIDSICFNDLMPDNKKQKKNELETILKKDNKTEIIKSKKIINNIGQQKNINNIKSSDNVEIDFDFSGNETDLYKISEDEEKKEVEESEDNIPEYNYLYQKIINADSFQ